MTLEASECEFFFFFFFFLIFVTEDILVAVEQNSPGILEEENVGFGNRSQFKSCYWIWVPIQL